MKSIHHPQRAFLMQIEERGGSDVPAHRDRRSNDELHQERRCPQGLRRDAASASSPARSRTAEGTLPRRLLAYARIAPQTGGALTSSEAPS